MLATLSTSRTEDLLASGGSSAAALTGGYQLAFFVALGFIVAAIAVTALVLRPEPAVVADEQVETLDPRHEFAFDEAS